MREDTFAEPPAPIDSVPEPGVAVPDPLEAFPTEAEVTATAAAAASAKAAKAAKAAEAAATAETTEAADAAEGAATVARTARPGRSSATGRLVVGASSVGSVAATVARKARPRRRTVVLVVTGAAAVVAVAAWLLVPGVSDQARRVVGRVWRSTPAALVIETTPPGWEVVEGARNLGTTPFRGTMPPGRHALLLRRGGETRALDVDLRAGVEVIHHLDLQGASSTGGLSIATSPPGAAVQVDGVGRGVSPVEVAGLAPGNHSVSVTAGAFTFTDEQVAVAAGKTTTLLVPVTRPPNPAGAAGFVTIAAPIELQVFDGDALVGSSRNQRIMLMPGRRALRLANPALGFERVIQVAVEAGATSKVTVPVPNGSLSVNAVPWAEVLLDGKMIGETPIANYAVLPGSHEVVLRNPKFPEQRRTVVVTLMAPLRVGVDLRQ